MLDTHPLDGKHSQSGIKRKPRDPYTVDELVVDVIHDDTSASVYSCSAVTSR